MSRQHKNKIDFFFFSFVCELKIGQFILLTIQHGNDQLFIFSLCVVKRKTPCSRPEKSNNFQFIAF